MRNMGGASGPSATQQQADYDAYQQKIKQQQADYDRHTEWTQIQQKRADALLAAQETNAVRHVKILEKWEEQGKRMDALLDKLEASRPK